MERGKSEIVDGRRGKVSNRPVLSSAIDSGGGGGMDDGKRRAENAACSKVAVGADGEVTLNIELGGKGFDSMDYSMIV